MSTSASGTQAVDRAALLVSTVVQAEVPLSYADLVDQCELPRSTTSRMLAALERCDLLGRDSDGNYVAGQLFREYSMRHDAWSEYWEAQGILAQPTLDRLSEETGETVNLAAPRGRRVVHVAQVDSTFLLGTRDWTQVEVPTHVSSLGKVLFAWGVLPLPTGRLQRVTAQSITSAAALERQLATIRAAGFAVTMDELELGLSGVAAPVRIGAGDSPVVAALGISGPTQRLAEHLDDLGQLVSKLADELSGLLGEKSPINPNFANLAINANKPTATENHSTRREGVA